MNFTTFFVLLSFVTATTITPGPNSVMIMASGVNFGFRRTTPHIAGVAMGVTLVLFLVGFGLSKILDEVPLLRSALMVLSTVYLLYLAWKIANAAPPKEQAGKARPLTFLQAVAFQWVNPKVWALGLSAATIYIPQHSLSLSLIVALTFGGVGIASNSFWARSGTVVRKYLSSHTHLRVFNIAMALLLVASLIPTFVQSD